MSPIKLILLIALECIRQSAMNALSLTINGALLTHKPIDLFKRPDIELDIQSMRLDCFDVFAVESLDQCAALCNSRNPEALETIFKHSDHITRMLDRGEQLRRLTPTTLQLLMKPEEQFSLHFREGFRYAELADLSPTDLEIIRAAKTFELFEGTSRGLCFLIKPETAKKDALINSTDSSPRVSIKTKGYFFDYLALFEAMNGFKLANSAWPEEQQAYTQVFDLGSNEANHLSAAKKALLAGRNHQREIYNKGHDYLRYGGCARECILSSARRWPGCRSFDVIVYQNHYRCFLNTIRLEPNERLGQNEHVQQWNLLEGEAIHYEPRPL